MTEVEAQSLLYKALETPYGIILRTSSSDLLKRRLYVARAEARKANNFDFDRISFQTSPTDPVGELYLVLKPLTKEPANVE